MKKFLTILFVILSITGFSQLNLNNNSFIITGENSINSDPLVVNNLITSQIGNCFRKALTNNSYTTVFTIACPPDSAISFYAIVSNKITASNGRQTEHNVPRVASFIYNGVLYSYSIVGGSQSAKSSGTLTISNPIVSYSSGIFTVQFKANSSLTSPTDSIIGIVFQGFGGILSK